MRPAASVRRVLLATTFVGALPLLSAPTWAAPVMGPEADPLVLINRPIFVFNDALDRVLLKPVAKTYDRVLPTPVKRSVSNVFQNLQTPISIVSLYAQGEGHKATTQVARFMFNSTVGLAGLFDVATPMGLERATSDFGITAGRYGVPAGPYVMLPLLGPSTLRDFPLRVVAAVADPRAYFNDVPRLAMVGTDVVDTRARVLPLEASVVGDRYDFLRDAYLQNRQFQVTGGVVTDDPFFDDAVSDDETPDEP